MKQMILDIRPDAPPEFGNFVTGANDELLRALQNAIRGEQHLYLWGPSGSGRTHLLRAAIAESLAAGRPARYLDATQCADSLPETPALLMAIDDAEALAPAAQIALFNAFNRARASSQTLLLAGSRPPVGLALREDLRTRIGQCLVFEVRPLDDVTRRAILAILAERRGLRLADEVTDFLLRHGRRDLSSLVTVLDALDRTSLERKRAVTLPLLREMIQAGLDI